MEDSTISDYRNINGGAGNMQNRLQMYAKKNVAVCGTKTTAKDNRRSNLHLLSGMSEIMGV